METPQTLQTLQQRITLLEAALWRGEAKPAPPPATPTQIILTFIFGLLAAIFGYFGVGLPTHYYHFVFAGLILLLMLQRPFPDNMKKIWRYGIAAVNFAVLSLLCKFLLGGGVYQPLAWITLSSVGGWQVDIVKVQAVFLLAAIAGTVFRLQTFASLCAFVLLIVSIPALVSFNWDWVLPFLICAGVNFYLQTRYGRLTV